MMLISAKYCKSFTKCSINHQYYILLLSYYINLYGRSLLYDEYRSNKKKKNIYIYIYHRMSDFITNLVATDNEAAFIIS